MRYLTISPIYISILGTLFIASSFQVNAHGYVRVPQSRSYQCSYNDDFNKGQKTPTNFNCGLGAEYEPQSIEVHNGFPEFGPPDGKIASGGIERFPLDEQSPTRWNKIDMKTGNNTFTWFLTMQHSTTNWRFFITKNGWDQSAPLTRATFDLTPFCQRNDYGAIPPLKTDIPFSCKIPEDHEGYHVILATWDIADTQNAFYQVIDVNLSK